MPDESADGCTRRAALGLALVAPALAGIAPLALFAGCRSEPEAVGTVVEVAAPAEGERVVVMRGEEPIELLRTGRNVRARSLWCTHMGCRVRWEPQRAVYRCPCHDGLYDGDGRVIGGPPPRPLRTASIALGAGDVVRLDAESLPNPG